MQAALGKEEEEFSGLDYNLIDKTKLHVTLEKYKDVARANFEFASQNIKEEEGRKSYIIESLKADINMFIEIQKQVNFICRNKDDLISQLKNIPSVIEQKEKKIQEKILNSKKESSVVNFEQLNQLKAKREEEENSMNEELLKTSYNKLLKTKDDFEICCVSCFTGLILNLKEPGPKDIEKCMRVYPDFFAKAKAVDPKLIDDFVKEVIFSKLVQIFEYFNNPNSVEIMKRYMHLLPFLNWSRAICELVPIFKAASSSKNFGKLECLEKKIGVMKELPMACSDIVSKMNQEMENLNNILKRSLQLKDSLQGTLESVTFYRTEYQEECSKEFKTLMEKNENSLESIIKKNQKSHQLPPEKIKQRDQVKMDSNIRPFAFCGLCSWFKK